MSKAETRDEGACAPAAPPPASAEGREGRLTDAELEPGLADATLHAFVALLTERYEAGRGHAFNAGGCRLLAGFFTELRALRARAAPQEEPGEGVRLSREEVETVREALTALHELAEQPSQVRWHVANLRALLAPGRDGEVRE
jgi:hypothetical protein